jgi:hypothetical protein
MNMRCADLIPSQILRSHSPACNGDPDRRGLSQLHHEVVRLEMAEKTPGEPQRLGGRLGLEKDMNRCIAIYDTSN